MGVVSPPQIKALPLLSTFTPPLQSIPKRVPGLFMSEQKNRLIASLKAPRIDCLYMVEKELLDGALREPSSFDTAEVGFEI